VLVACFGEGGGVDVVPESMRLVDVREEKDTSFKLLTYCGARLGRENMMAVLCGMIYLCYRRCAKKVVADFASQRGYPNVRLTTQRL
jgi:hypothetical protein